MGFASVGGNASASNTLANTINFNPNMQWGENTSDLSSSLDQRASSEALVEDTAKFAASAGVAVGGGQAQGGSAALSDTSGMASALPNVFSGESLANITSNTPLLIAGVGGSVALVLGVLALKKKKR